MTRGDLHPGGLAARLELAYAVAGGPVAWLAQMNLDYPLVATPCFPGPQRNLMFPANAQWAFVAAVVIYLALVAAAVGSGIVARQLFRRLRAGNSESSGHFEGAGPGRVLFLAFAGMLLGFGFSIAILINSIALMVVPPCAI